MTVSDVHIRTSVVSNWHISFNRILFKAISGTQ